MSLKKLALGDHIEIKLSQLDKAHATKGTQTYTINTDLQAELQLPSVHRSGMVVAAGSNVGNESRLLLLTTGKRHSTKETEIIYRIYKTKKSFEGYAGISQDTAQALTVAPQSSRLSPYVHSISYSCA